MRAYIAVVLLTAGLVGPAVAEAAQPLANVQQPEAEQAAQKQRQKAYRRAATTRNSQAKQPRAAQGTAVRVAQNSGPTRIVPATAETPAAQPSSWSSSMLSWWRGESTPAGAGQAAADQVSAEPAAARVETTAAAEPAKASRRKVRRPKRTESTATGAVPEAAPADVKEEKPTRSKRRSARRSKSRAHQVAARSSASHQAEKPSHETPPEPRKKPGIRATQQAVADKADGNAAVGSISPADQAGGAQHMAALSSDRDAAGGEATWWQRQGNPVVFNFRDCVASYASREAGHSKEGTWADLLIRATEGDCRAPFDEMARTLAKRFGETRIEPVMRELIDTTFLPAAKQAAASATPSSGIPPLPAIPDGTPTQ